MTQIFLSYSRVDLAFVEQLYTRLQRMFPDFKLWYDKSPHGLLGGDNWWQSILDAIGESDIFIYILSNDSVNSIYCQAEFAEARRLQKRIITIQARDRTEIPDSLGDIQFIDMKDGPTDPVSGDQLVASIRRQLEQVKKRRPLWKPATARPGKETQHPRAANTPDVDTPPLLPPTQETQKGKEETGYHVAVVGGLVAGIFALIAAGITILPPMLERSDKAATQAIIETTQTQIAQVPIAALTSDVVVTNTVPIQTPTEIDISLLVGTMDAQATDSQATLNIQSTSVVRATEYAVGTQSLIHQTETATLWTATPTANITASIEAYRTQQAQTVAINQTSTAGAWTHTPLPTKTFTPSATPTATFTLSPEQMALTPVAANADWKPIEREFGGVTMVLVPAGRFMMGSETGENETPMHQQIFTTPYWIDKYEVTNEQFANFQGKAVSDSYWTGAKRPREQIDWFEAQDFCALRQGRLPTEREWEYAARGPDSLEYPWGSSWNRSNTVWSGNSNSQTADADGRPTGASWIGAEGLSGNVWEWVSTIYGIDTTEDYNFIDAGETIYLYPWIRDERERDSSNITYIRVMRGGSWEDPDGSYSRGATRGNFSPDTRSYIIGFRCVRTE